MNSISEFNQVESNMRKRRKEIQAVLKDSNEGVFSMSTFPRLGCSGNIQISPYLKCVALKCFEIYDNNNAYLLIGFTYPEALPEPKTSFTRSLFWPNAATFHGHPRFKTLTSNIRERRGEKVWLYIDVYDSEMQ